VRGRDIDCGCVGTTGTTISWWLVARNAALAITAAGVAVVTSDRVLARVPAGDVVAVVVTVVAVLGTARLLVYGARVRAAMAAGVATEAPQPDRSLAGWGGAG
jgi:hypothetical protein